MQVRFFTIPIHDSASGADELNALLAGQRVLAVDRQLVQNGANSAWALCVSFDTAGAGRPASGGAGERGRREKIDYREVLDEQAFAIYARLRSLRKELAEREGIPIYAVFTNEQMAEMVQRRVTDATAMQAIPGIGDGRIEKYAAAFLAILRQDFVQPPTPAGPAGAP